MTSTCRPTRPVAAPPAPTRIRHRRWASAVALASLFAAVPTVAGASDARPVSTAAPIEALRLDCRAIMRSPAERPVDDSVEHGVGCRWSVPTVDTAAGVRLLRVIVGADLPREQVFATRDVTENRYIDAPLRPDHRYAYRVQALSRTGRVVASSRTVTVAVPSPPDDGVEVLRLQCRRSGVDADAATRVRIGCRWTLPTEHRARTLTLWRSVDGGARERVASFDPPFASSYRDVVAASSSKVVYAVIATDGDDSIVARSRAEVVVLDDRKGRAD